MIVEDVLGRIRRHWMFGVVGVLLGGALGYVSTFAKMPIYQAEAILAATTSRAGSSSLAALLGPLQGIARSSLSLNDDADLSERAVTIMRSRAFTEKFVEAQGLVDVLTTRSKMDEWLRRPEPTPSLRLYQAARVFRTSIAAVRVDTRTGFVTIAVRWSDPVEAARWANALADSVNEEARVRAIGDADNAIAFLQDELRSQSTVSIQSAINRLIESQLNNKMLAKTRPQYVYSVLAPALPAPTGTYVSPDRPLTAAAAAMMGGLVALLIVLRRRS